MPALPLLLFSKAVQLTAAAATRCSRRSNLDISSYGISQFIKSSNSESVATAAHFNLRPFSAARAAESRLHSSESQNPFNSAAENDANKNDPNKLLNSPIRLEDLDGKSLQVVCAAIGSSDVAADIELRRALATRLDACVADLRTDALISCLNTLVRTEAWKDYGVADQLLRQMKGVVWGRAIGLNNVVKMFQEMAPKVSVDLLVNLFGCSVALGISTTSLLDVILPELTRRFSRKSSKSSTEKVEGCGRFVLSPESIGPILRSVEICQEARIISKHNAGLSNKKLGVVHQELCSALRDSLPLLFRWGANEWAWRSVVALADEAEWRDADAFTEKQLLETLRGKARDAEAVAAAAGHLSARVMGVLEEDARECVKIVWSQMLLELGTGDEQRAGEVTATALKFILDCCYREVPNKVPITVTKKNEVPKKVNGKKVDLKGKKSAAAAVEDNEEEDLEEQMDLCNIMTSLAEQGFRKSSSVEQQQVTPALAVILAVLKLNLPLASDFGLYQLFRLLMNLKPFVTNKSRISDDQQPTSHRIPYRVPKLFATHFSDCLMNEFNNRLRCQDSLTSPERLNSQIILCLIFRLLNEIPRPHKFLKQNPAWESKLISVHVPNLLSVSSTIEDVTCLLKGVANLEKSPEQQELTLNCLLTVLQRYRAVGLSDSAFLSIAHCLPCLTTMKKQLSAVCVMLDHYLTNQSTINALTFISFIKILPPSLCSELAAAGGSGAKLLAQSLQLLTTLICAGEAPSTVNACIQVPIKDDQTIALDVSSLALKFLFDGITIASILLEELPANDASAAAGSPTLLQQQQFHQQLQVSSAAERQTAVGCLHLLDSSLPSASASVTRLLRRFHPRRLTPTVVQSLPHPSKLIQLLEETRRVEKAKTLRGRAVGFTPTHRRFMEMKRENEQPKDEKKKKWREPKPKESKVNKETL